MAESILDEIANACNIYISDLKYIHQFPQAMEYLKELPFEQYSLQECNYVLSYIFKKDCMFQNHEQLREYLKNIL